MSFPDELVPNSQTIVHAVPTPPCASVLRQFLSVIRLTVDTGRTTTLPLFLLRLPLPNTSHGGLPGERLPRIVQFLPHSHSPQSGVLVRCQPEASAAYAGTSSCDSSGLLTQNLQRSLSFHRPLLAVLPS